MQKIGETKGSSREANVAPPPGIPTGKMNGGEPEEFIPSAARARYPGDFKVAETDGPLVIEDEQMNTEWHNPTDRDVVVEVHVGTDAKNALWRKWFNAAPPAKRQEMMTGLRVFVIKANSTRMIPSEYDLAIQRTQCIHPQCHKKRDQCRNVDHPRVVVSGLAPQLVCRRWEKVPSLHQNLDTALAATAAATKALAEATAHRMLAEQQSKSAEELLASSQLEARRNADAREAAERELQRVNVERQELERRLAALEAKK
jgi:hypothetical protein